MTTVAQFAITYQQYLDENGELKNSSLELAKDKETLCKLYRTMVCTRMFDKKAIALQRTGKMGTYAPINGQEALSTAIGHAMQPEDVFIPYYRDYAAQFQRGVKMSEILSYWGGDERGSNYACGSEDLPICVPIASQCLHATGVAFAFKYRQQARVAVVCVGEGGSSEGDFYEALNVAGVWNLPIVFVVNNNHWAISVPRNQQTSCQTIAQKAIAAGFTGIQIDGNDILAARQTIGEAIEKARRGEGPTLIEGLTYRLCDHTTADDATRYQPCEEVEAAKLKEPLQRFKQYLISQSYWSEQEEEQLIKECTKDIDEAVSEYLNSIRQPVSSMFDYHYAELPDYLIEQRAIAMEDATNA
ncbi:pyruvate dehydrogenase (acetyl-transferring) E1 component subunit alpha [Legionella israelensis]|uniref:Pyruvate dehydrogenase E1 component subunit alpha n=1 Tax=Legionella israelensis TaxID=454 RepID=A0A0W0V3K0_9GAMM|nr:pyruvate dehydrogenase (acetyl-transferring) E1 component subunit alpha [Legionella israelensis]KTD14711.1 pyruvate dehydrogenase E1 alpha subunit [Legionella israelensis]QBR84085.1 pyruvate dehydrogenase (acetyl-transferring) E1 component subunit alpha [Legionella israelensis]QBS10972.1 pyruvate dehydrogenase (acetyl-transferring) E1 component subunit alpha [Legionella israelensis]QDP72813.1 pyruvate dehydrogenase (acetyl-transferring) E1 component subunit alpha [Legionella israelensis]SCY